MKNKTLLVSFFWLLTCVSFSQVTIKLGSVENAEPGTFINVPLSVTGLSETGQAFIGVEVLFSFQENIITFDSLANGHSITPVIQWFAGSQNGKVSANWLDPNLQPVNVEENAILIEFVFFYSGGQTNLAFDQSATVIYDANANVISISAYIDGVITQGQGSENSTWNGEASWDTPENWSNGIPGDNTDAILNSGVSTLTSGGVCRDLTINQGAKLVLTPGNSLTINGDFTNAGEISIESDSLIQGSLIIKGTITQTGVSAMTKNIYDGIYYHLSTPVLGASADIFGSDVVTSYNENNGTWSVVTPASILEPLRGYAIESSATHAVNFNGHYNSTDMTTGLSFTTQGNPESEGWNLIGNPYTSSFNTDEYLSTDNADRAIYLWDGFSYRVWNGTAGNIPYGIVPPMTAFFIKANSSNASATFDRNGKIHDFSHFTNAYTNPDNVLQVNLWNFDDNTVKDVAFLQIEPNASYSYDGGFDALKLDNMLAVAELFFTGEDDVRYAISAIPEAVEAVAGIKIPENGTYKIEAMTSLFLPDKPVYLIDQELQIVKDLRTEEYVFNVTAGEHPERFKIVLTGLETMEFDWKNKLVAFSSNGNIILNPLTVLGRSKISIYDLCGRIVCEAEENLEPGNTVTLKGIPGINIVRIQSPEFAFTLKLFIR